MDTYPTFLVLPMILVSLNFVPPILYPCVSMRRIASGLTIWTNFQGLNMEHDEGAFEVILLSLQK